MGKEKRLFLLAVMTVMMSTVGYSKDIPIKIENGETEKNTEKIEVIEQGKTGIIIKEGTFTNEKLGEIVVTNGKGVFVSAKNKNVKAKLENNGKILISGGKGIELKAGEVTNAGLVNIEKGIGLDISGGTFVNTGKEANGLHVSGEGSVGINQTGGTVENKGLINVKDKGTGIIVSMVHLIILHMEKQEYMYQVKEV